MSSKRCTTNGISNRLLYLNIKNYTIPTLNII
jgi:hypothetical protein